MIENSALEKNSSYSIRR